MHRNVGTFSRVIGVFAQPRIEPIDILVRRHDGRIDVETSTDASADELRRLMRKVSSVFGVSAVNDKGIERAGQRREPLRAQILRTELNERTVYL